MAKKKEEFETEEQAEESVAVTNILGELKKQEQKDIPVSVNESEQTSIKISNNEKENDIKANGSDVFMNILNIGKKETKNKKVNFLLTETNFNHLVELSDKTGTSRNEIINRLIDSCYQNVNL